MKLALPLAFLLASGAAALAEDNANLKSAYEVWEDFEGGRVCRVELTDERTIGGNVIGGDVACVRELDLDEEPAAWLIDNEGWFVLIDATRRILVRFEPSPDGVSFYADRRADGLPSLNLTLPADEQNSFGSGD